MLMTHYRQPIDWTADRLVEARKTLSDWAGTCPFCWRCDRRAGPPVSRIGWQTISTRPAQLATCTNSSRQALRSRADARRDFAAALKFLGLWDGETGLEILGYGLNVQAGPSQADAQPLIDARDAARAAKNFAEADRIRDELIEMGFAVKDTPEGTKVEPAR